MDWLDLSGGMATPVHIIALRLFLASVAGGAIGLEREKKGTSAGLRTHMLTALAAATFMLITLELFHEVHGAKGANADPTRVIEAVTAGVAFLAAGAIIQNRDRVRGLTTGAGMWLAGAIGVAAGGGFYALTVLATLFGLVIIAVLRRAERRFL